LQVSHNSRSSINAYNTAFSSSSSSLLERNKNHGYDLFQTRVDIARQVVIRKPSPEYLQAFLRMEEVERQLGIIQVAMKKDWCGKW
jgi:hypothetical protein